MEHGAIRQGDVLLIPCEVTPPASAMPTREVILALGEATGHAHRLRADEVLEWSVDGQRYVHVQSEEMGTLGHEDHDPIPAAVVEPHVTYRVVPQQVLDLAGQWRKVVD